MIRKLDCFRSRTSYRPNAFSPAILNPHRFSKLFAPSRIEKSDFSGHQFGVQEPQQKPVLPQRASPVGYAATSPDSPLDFHQAQTAAERSGVANPHCWSLMLPTSARVAQEVYEPLTGIQHPMLCSRMGDTWQIGTTSIRENHKIASGLRFIHWCHASPNVQAKQNPKNDPTVRVYQHTEEAPPRVSSFPASAKAPKPSP